MKEQNYTDLQFKVPAEEREQKLKQVQQTSIFLRFIEERSYEDQKLLFAEIDNILDEGMPMMEYLETGFKEDGLPENSYTLLCGDDDGFYGGAS